MKKQGVFPDMSAAWRRWCRPEEVAAWCRAAIGVLDEIWDRVYEGSRNLLAVVGLVFVLTVLGGIVMGAVSNASDAASATLQTGDQE
ncbi:MAG: hypothetical protein AAFR76_03595 [Planctomycetota bacterium]